MKSYIIVMLFLLYMLTSCKKNFLVENPQSFLGPDNALSNSQGFLTAITGLHTIARDEWGLVYGGFTDGMFFAGTDICFARGHAEYTNFQSYGSFVNSGNASSEAMYRWAYILIANANEIITHAENPDIVWTSSIKKYAIIAEARFFRAYAYRTLVYLFGDVPIVTEVVKPFKTNFTRDPKANVLRFLINDLKFAADSLPATVSQPGRIVQAAAQHYLGEMYILNGSPDSARTVLLKITNSSLYKLMSARFGTHLSDPGDLYADLFLENNQNNSANKETIWAQQFQFNIPGGNANEWQRRAWVPAYYNNSGMVISAQYGGRGVGLLEPFDWVLNSYEANDVRNSVYNVMRNYVYNNPTYALYGTPIAVTQQTKDQGTLYNTVSKFNFYQSTSPTFAHMQKDRYRIRLAETYLLLAEASIDLNDMTSAATYINVVRQRANASPVLASNVTMDYLLDEHARELIGEYPRRYLLLRTGKLLARTRSLNPYSGPLISDYNVLCPIPQSVIDANTGATFPQNPGY